MNKILIRCLYTLTLALGCYVANGQVSISGPDGLCGTGSTGQFTISGPFSQLYGWTWSVPSGADILSGQGSNTITVRFNNPGMGQTIVVSNNGLTAIKPVGIYTVPPQPFPISGPSTICVGGTADFAVTVPGSITDVGWTVPGATILSKNGNSVKVNFPDSYTGGQITAYGISGACSAGPSISMPIAVGPSPLSAPTGISGANVVAAGQSGVTYSVPVVAGSTGFQWTLPQSATLVSGSNTRSITVNYSSSFTGGVIQVYATAGSCSSPSTALVITTSTPQPPPPPGVPAAAGQISGDSPCMRGSDVVVTFSVPPIPGATYYNWSFGSNRIYPEGNTGSSSTINLRFLADITETNVVLSVAGVNSYGAGVSSSYVVHVFRPPAAAGPITGASQVCAGQTSVVYSVPPISGALDYIWFESSGGVSSIVRDTDLGNRVKIDFASDFIGNHGDLVMFGIAGSCGAGPAAILHVSLLTTPSVPLLTDNICGDKILTHDTPPSGTTWYWQGTNSNGKSTALSNQYAASSSGTYYLRAKTIGYECWSDAVGVPVTVNPIPAAPDVPVVSSNTCGPKTLTRTTPPTGILYDWQGTNPLGPLHTPNVNAPVYTVLAEGDNVIYYISAYNNVTGCRSSATSVSVSVVNPYPPASSGYVGCEWDAANLTTSGFPPGGTIKWYDQNGQYKFTGTTYPADLYAGKYIYYMKSVNSAGCEGSNSSNMYITVSTCDDQLNWTESIAYGQDANGNAIEVGHTKSYMDGFGDLLQSQSKNYTTNQVLAAQPIYDSYNTPVASTLPAPINATDFSYRYKFLTNASGQRYGDTDFDQRVTTNLNTPGEVKNPNPVGNSHIGTLGWYYSNNNTLEPLTPTTSYPYSRSYTPEGPNPTVSTVAGAGDSYKMGSGHEVTSEKQIFQSTELSYYLSLRPQFVHNSNITYSGAMGYKYISTDPDGKKTVSFVDADGHALASALLTGTNYSNWSYSYYNDLGQLVATIAPKGVIIGDPKPPTFVTLYKYDYLGRLVETTSTDEGTSQFVYSIDGKIRFSQNQEQRNALPQRFSYTNYDYLGRSIESGEYTSTGTNPYIFESIGTPTSTYSVLNLVDINIPRGKDIETITFADFPALSQKFDNVRCTDYTFIKYDLLAADLPAGDTDHAQQNNLFGQVSKTQNAVATTWYSYNEFGALEWSKQSLPDVGYKTVDYIYDKIGNVIQVIYQKNKTDKFYHFYSYDADQRLSQVYTSLNGSDITLQAKYYYYLHGPLKRIELASNLQGVDYTYTLQGALKSINHMDVTNDPGADGTTGTHSSFSKDVFGLTLGYYDNDFASAGHKAGNISPAGSTNNFAGTLKSVGWFTPVDNTPAMRAYNYTYDNRNQLQNAQWGTITGTGGNYTTTVTSAYKEGVGAMGYDPNGNIQSMVRTGKTGNSIANYGYVYEPYTNKLDKVNDNGSVLVDYSYNSIGQMTSYVEAGDTMKVTYNAYGLVKEILNGNKLAESFVYDDRGDRIQKINYDSLGIVVKTTYYVHDVAGNVLATYEKKTGDPLLIEVPVYGNGRLGVYKPGKTTFYELNDNLGNVRAVIGAPYTEIIKATMESESAGTEDKQFKNIAPRTQVSTIQPCPNNTPGGNEAIYLNNGRPVGPAIILKVSPGDVVSFDTYAYYEGGSGYSNTTASAIILDGIISAFGGISGAPGDPGKIFNGLNSALTSGGFAAAFAGSGNDGVPAASLNMIMFDNNMKSDYINMPMSSMPVTSAANHALQHITISPITIPAPGYIYVYVNNNSNSANRVYFDDITVTQLHSPFVAGGDYYPYGLAMEDRQIKIESYRYGYQGQYSEKDSVTGWNNFDLRQYDARFGRWLSPDPYGQFDSPYSAMGNNPASGTDPDGGWCCGGKILGSSAGKAVASEAAREAGKSMSTTLLNEVVVRSAENGYGIMAQATQTLIAEPIFSTAMQRIATSQLNEDVAMKKPSTSFFYDGIARSGQSLSEWKPGIFEQWGNSTGFIGSTTYSIADGIYTTARTFMPWLEAKHLDGRTAQGGDLAEGLASTVATFMPFGPKGTGNQVHHVITQQLFHELNLGKYGFKLDHLKNLIELPTPFHGNHPAYTKYVRNEILKLEEVTLEHLIDIQSKMTQQIQRIHSSGAYERLNHYYKYTLGL